MHGQDYVAKTPAAYIAALDEPRRSEVAAIDAFIRKTVPKLKPVIMGGMLGYGAFHYRYASGREGDTCTVGVASNKQHLSLYICATNEKGHLAEQYAPRLGKAGRNALRRRDRPAPDWRADGRRVRANDPYCPASC